MGFDISNIKNAALKALAVSIDEDKNYQGKDKGKLEDGAEMSVFLAKSTAILMAEEKEAMEEVLTIADNANRHTYEIFKEGLTATIEKMKGNVPGFNGLIKILDRMMQRFEKEPDKVATTEFEKQVAGSGSVVNDKEIKPE